MSMTTETPIFKYGSPNHEKSIFKWIPMEELADAKEKLTKLWPNVKFRIVFRGPRFDKYKLFTCKDHATHFSVYTKNRK